MWHKSKEILIIQQKVNQKGFHVSRATKVQYKKKNNSTRSTPSLVNFPLCLMTCLNQTGAWRKPWSRTIYAKLVYSSVIVTKADPDSNLNDSFPSYKDMVVNQIFNQDQKNLIQQMPRTTDKRRFKYFIKIWYPKT